MAAHRIILSLALCLAGCSGPGIDAPFGESLGDIFSDRLWPEWPVMKSEEWVPSMNFSEKDGKYMLSAEIPGMKKEDININIDKGVLTVSGKRESSKEEKEADYYLKEVYYGSFSRSFRLPGDIDESKVDAAYTDGVLTVAMPHTKVEKKKKVEVK